MGTHFSGRVLLLLGIASLASLATADPSRAADLAELCREGMECLVSREPELTKLGFNVERILAFHLKELRQLRSEEAKDDTLEQRAILTLKKLRKYCLSGEFEKLGEQPLHPGHYDENDPILGSVAGELALLQESGTPAIRRLISALYLGGAVCSFPLSASDSSRPAHFYMIPGDQLGPAQELADKELDALIHNRNRARSRTTTYAATRFRPGVTWIYDVDNAWNDWKVEVAVDPSGISVGDGKWRIPASIVAIHELGHVARTRPGAPEHEENPQVPGEEDAPLDELGPVIEQIVLQDEISKSIAGESIQNRRNYPCHPPAAPGKPPLDLGETANTFRHLMRKYGSPERAILSPEGLQFVDRHF